VVVKVHPAFYEGGFLVAWDSFAWAFVARVTLPCTWVEVMVSEVETAYAVVNLCEVEGSLSVWVDYDVHH
jgi:hypothetical protein